jgi:hypothetical protein
MSAWRGFVADKSYPDQVRSQQVKQHQSGKTQIACSNRPNRRRSAGINRPLLYVASFLVAVTAMMAFYKYVIFAAATKGRLRRPIRQSNHVFVVEVHERLRPAFSPPVRRWSWPTRREEPSAICTEAPSITPIATRAATMLSPLSWRFGRQPRPAAMAVNQKSGLAKPKAFAAGYVLPRSR